MRSSRSLRFARRGRGQPQHQHLCAGRPHALDNFARRKIGAEIRDAQAAAGGEHRRAQRADLVALAGQGRKEQPGRHVRARVQPEERAEDVPHRRGHQVFMRDAGRPPVPVVAHLRQHRHQDIPEQFERRQDRREPADLLVDGRGIVFLQRGGERGGIDRCPSCGSDRGRRARAGGGGEAAQFRIGEPGEAADAVSVFHRAAQQAQARDVGVRVHPAAIVTDRSDGAMAALPRAQRVDRRCRSAWKPRGSGSCAGVSRGFLTEPHSGRPPRTRLTPPLPTPRRPASARTATGAAWSSW